MPRPSTYRRKPVHHVSRRNQGDDDDIPFRVDDLLPGDDYPSEGGYYPSEGGYYDEVPFDADEPVLDARPSPDAAPGTYDFLVDGQPVAVMRWSPGAGAFHPGKFGKHSTAGVSREFRGKLPGPAPRAFVDPWPTFHGEPRVAQQQPAVGLAQRAARADADARAAQAAMNKPNQSPASLAQHAARRALAWREALNAHEALGQLTRASCERAIGGEVPGETCLADLGSMGEAQPLKTRVMCDRVVPVSKYAEWALEGLPHGPHELEKPHVAGSVECCFYHPATAERLRLQDEMRRAWYDGLLGHNATEADLAQAIASAEDQHPLRDVWQTCDAQVLSAVAQYEPGTGGMGSSGVANGVRRFVMLLRKKLYDNAREQWKYLAEDVNSDLSFDDVAGLDATFADAVKLSYAANATQEDRMWWGKNFRGFSLPPPRKRPKKAPSFRAR